ncbi:MAG: flagellar protein FlaG [Actinobacteria bacterium]|nr:flagellar protein FlaG [Actinomycetota bacterium]
MDVGKVGAAYASFFLEGRHTGRPREEGIPDRVRWDGLRASAEEAALEERLERRRERAESEAVSQSLLSRLVQRHPREVKLQVHEATNRVIIRITDAQTGETLAEVPRENYLDMVASFLSRLDRLQGETRGVNLDRVF